MSPTLTEKQKDAPGNGAFFSFSAKVQNYAGLMQKVHFRLKNSILSRYPIVPSSSGSKCASDPSVPGIQLCLSPWTNKSDKKFTGQNIYKTMVCMLDTFQDFLIA